MWFAGMRVGRLGTTPAAQRQLATWWLVLYSLSTLSRYYPMYWTETLDQDRRPLAGRETIFR